MTQRFWQPLLREIWDRLLKSWLTPHLLRRRKLLELFILLWKGQIYPAELLKIIKFFQQHNTLKLPKTAEPINKFMERKANNGIPPAKTEQVPFPACWNTANWHSVPDIPEVQLLDPVAMWAVQILDPKGWGSPWRTGIHYQTFQQQTSSKYCIHLLTPDLA